jgi:hypothetical protein
MVTNFLRDNKTYRYPKSPEFKQLVEQLKWDLSRVRVWIENRKNKDKDRPKGRRYQLLP